MRVEPAPASSASETLAPGKDGQGIRSEGLPFPDRRTKPRPGPAQGAEPRRYALDYDDGAWM
jgi:hypothetical protein